jgi:hypothetical protein
VEIGSRSERVLREWSAGTGITFDVRTYLSQGEALDALANGEVEGMVGTLDSLRRAGRQQMSLISQPILDEPYALVLRRWDVNLRNLLNRSLQNSRPAAGSMRFSRVVPGETMDFNVLVPSMMRSTAIRARSTSSTATRLYPTNPVLERIQSGQPVRVRGLALDDNAPPRCGS